MNETQLLRITLVVALLGIIILFFLAKNIEVSKVRIDEISDEFIGKRVAISGTVQEIRLAKNMTFITIAQKESVNNMLVVAFEPLTFIQQDDSVIVSGQVKEYYGKLEIVAESVELGEGSMDS